MKKSSLVMLLLTYFVLSYLIRETFAIGSLAHTLLRDGLTVVIILIFYRYFKLSRHK